MVCPETNCTTPLAFVGEAVAGIHAVPLWVSQVLSENQFPLWRVLKFPFTEGTGTVGAVGAAQPNVMVWLEGTLDPQELFAVTAKVAVAPWKVAA